MRTLLFPLAVLLFSLLLIGCDGCSDSDTSYLDPGSGSEIIDVPPTDNSIKIPYTEMVGNTVTIPVKINEMQLDMIYDTGASSTCITLAEAQYLYSKGSLTLSDIEGVQQFQTASGDISAGLKVLLRNVSIGDEINLQDIEAIVVPNQEAPLLLGQSVMKEFSEISVDRENKVIKFFK